MKSKNWWYRATTRLPLSKAFFWIAVSVVAISGSAGGTLGAYLYYRSQKKKDPRYQIAAIVQTGPERDQLKTEYFAELLGLSVDRPQNLYVFDTHKAEEKLNKSPVIEKASVKRVAPGILFIDYQARKPAAFLGDYTNTAIDKKGVLFPFKPFYTPKNLPEVVFGIWKAPQGDIWGKQLRGSSVDLAFEIIEKFENAGIPLVRLDVSHAFSKSFGRREIIAEAGEAGLGKKMILRLSSDSWKRAFSQYLALRRNFGRALPESVPEQPYIVDLRIADLAFIR